MPRPHPRRVGAAAAAAAVMVVEEGVEKQGGLAFFSTALTMTFSLKLPR